MPPIQDRSRPSSRSGVRQMHNRPDQAIGGLTGRVGRRPATSISIRVAAPASGRSSAPAGDPSQQPVSSAGGHRRYRSRIPAATAGAPRQSNSGSSIGWALDPGRPGRPGRGRTQPHPWAGRGSGAAPDPDRSGRTRPRAWGRRARPARRFGVPSSQRLPRAVVLDRAGGTTPGVLWNPSMPGSGLSPAAVLPAA
jgi:hypothetical protein